MTDRQTIVESRGLQIGLVGMADNIATRVVIAELERQNIRIKLLILQQPDMGGQWRRLKRKIASAGILSALKRIWQSLHLRHKTAGADENGLDLKKYEHLYTADPNSESCVAFVRDQGIDLLISSTDAMLKRRLFNAPKIATLNAHPGWAPAYRGLGAMPRQVGDGFCPAITVHVIDEGVDTGPALLRREIDFSELITSKAGDALLHIWQAQCFAEVIKRIEEHGQLQFIDTFLEPSNMTRGVPHKKAALLTEKARRDSASLRALSIRQEGKFDVS